MKQRGRVGLSSKVSFAWLLVGIAACNFGPSEERLGCLNGCAREKDSCMLNATTAEAIQACDDNARLCALPCPQ